MKDYSKPNCFYHKESLFRHNYEKLKSFICSLLLIMCPFVKALADNLRTAPQNQKEIILPELLEGKVVDENNQPLVGVTVTVKDKKDLGTVTNVNGIFRLKVPSQKEYILVFSYIGMKTQEMKINKKRDIVVIMENNSEMLSETVITGIYKRKAESFTGSMATYSKSELKQIGNQSLLQSLSVLDPSFVILDNNLSGSDPNSLLKVNINGSTSIKGLQDTYNSDPDRPLFILDGFETTLERISDLSMDRVESVTILKDAASTAIYGAKAANGVIVIETKKPTTGKLRFSYTGNYAVSWADLSDYNLMNAKEKLEFEKLSGYYGLVDKHGNILNAFDRENYFNRYRNIVAGVNTNWLIEPLRTGWMQDHSVNAEGGDASFRYGLTFRYKDNAGVMKKSGRQNLDGSINIAYRIERFNLSNQTNIYYTNESNNTVPFSDFAQANPYYPKRGEDGKVYKVLESYSTIAGTEYVYNPLWNFQQHSFNEKDWLTVNNNFNVEFFPIDKLRINGRFGFTTTRGKGEKFKSPFDTEFIRVEQLKRGSYTRDDENNTSFDGSLIVGYGNVIGKHVYNIIGGSQLSSSETRNSIYSSQGYISDQFYNPNFSNGYPEGGKPTSNVNKVRSASFYFNGNYSYGMRYLLDFNIRKDGASIYGISNPFSTTYSIGTAWNLHNENFFKKSNIVNQLKLRYSFGNPGNQNIDAKAANNVYGYYTKYPNPFGLAALVSRWGNRELKWKRTLTHNFGVNANLFNNRLYAVVDYSIRKSNPELIRIDQLPSTGALTIPMNMGATDNRSISILLSYDILKKKDLLWKTSLNLLHAKTTYYNIGDLLERLNREGRSNQTLVRYADGASTTSLWAVKSLGIDPANGNEVFLKKDGTYTYQWDSSEEVVCGDTTPDVQGNWGTVIRYKNFAFNVNFAYRFGGQAVLQTLLNKVENITDLSIKYNQDKRALHDRWHQAGDNVCFKRIDDTSPTKVSSRFIADENTLECTNLSIGYEDTQSKWLHNFGLSSATFRIYTNNIFRLSTIREERGLNYPFSRSVSASVNLRF